LSSLTLKTVTTVAAAAVACAVATTTFATSASASSTNLFAKLDSTGTLVAGGHVTSTTQYGPGRYEVTFDQDVSGCAYVATTENAYSQAVQVFTAGGHASVDGVYVETKNQGGGLTSAPFDLVVDCGAAASTPFAVVGYSANLVRSSSGVTMTHLGSGRYDVKFPSAVNDCAAIATVADPGNALVYSPAGVYTGEGANNKTIYLETKNPGGGLADGVPFHLAVFCAHTADVQTALINADGTTNRGSGTLASFESAAGQYTLVARKNVASCATVATRGSLDRAVPYTPSTVEWVPGPAANTVGFQVRSLLFFGGALDQQQFHVALVC
jgi:hypothetical protein